MSYVSRVLQPGEQVIAIGRLHWVIYLGAILLAILAIIIAAFAPSFPEYWNFIMIAAGAVMVVAIGWALKEWFDQWITEIAVTNLRVIYKKGFIRRHTSEMNMEKVESVTVYQPILGRILGYGTVNVRGTGVGLEQLHRVGNPIALRNAIIAR